MEAAERIALKLQALLEQDLKDLEDMVDKLIEAKAEAVELPEPDAIH